MRCGKSLDMSDSRLREFRIGVNAQRTTRVAFCVSGLATGRRIRLNGIKRGVTPRGSFIPHPTPHYSLWPCPTKFSVVKNSIPARILKEGCGGSGGVLCVTACFWRLEIQENYDGNPRNTPVFTEPYVHHPTPSIRCIMQAALVRTKGRCGTKAFRVQRKTKCCHSISRD